MVTKLAIGLLQICNGLIFSVPNKHPFQKKKKRSFYRFHLLVKANRTAPFRLTRYRIYTLGSEEPNTYPPYPTIQNPDRCTEPNRPKLWSSTSHSPLSRKVTRALFKGMLWVPRVVKENWSNDYRVSTPRFRISLMRWFKIHGLSRLILFYFIFLYICWKWKKYKGNQGCVIALLVAWMCLLSKQPFRRFHLCHSVNGEWTRKTELKGWK